MSQESKFKITWVSFAISFGLQCIALGWFAADLNNGVKKNGAEIEAIKLEQFRRTDRVYLIDRVRDDIERIKEDIKEIKRVVKQ